jgi:hypothetical protein
MRRASCHDRAVDGNVSWRRSDGRHGDGHGSEIVDREPSGVLLELGVAAMASAIESS